MAFGLMRGEPRFANANITAKVIRQPRSNFEQYEALRVSQDLVRGNPSPGGLKAVREAIAVAEANGSLRTGSDHSRSNIADQILKEIQSGQREGETE